MLSVIIITKNEASHIETCLKSVSWADEIIVLDSGSTDNTVALCKKYTTQVFQTDWPGFGLQKQRVLAKAKGNWVLSIDADESVSEHLAKEIKETIRDAQHEGYKIPRSSNYCGHTMRHGGWWPDYTLRLFKRTSGNFSSAKVHESVIITGSVGKLQNPLLHEAFTDLNEVLLKMNHYSTLASEMKMQQGKNSRLGTAILKGLWTFFRTYLLQRAFLDGAHGLMLSISNAEGAYYKYAKLYLLHRQSKQN